MANLDHDDKNRSPETFPENEPTTPSPEKEGATTDSWEPVAESADLESLLELEDKPAKKEAPNAASAKEEEDAEASPDLFDRDENGTLFHEGGKTNWFAALPILAVILACVIFSGIKTAGFFQKDYREGKTIWKEAHAFEKENKPFSALDSYFSLLQTGINPVTGETAQNTRALYRSIELLFQNGYYSDASELLSSIDHPIFNYRILSIKGNIGKIYESVNYVDSFLTALESDSENIDFASVIAEIDKKIGTDKKMDDAFLYYLQHQLSLETEIDLQTSYGYIEKAVSQNKRYHWMIPFQAKALIRIEEYDKALELLNQRELENLEDADVYHQKAVLFLLTDKPADAVAAAEKATDLESIGSYELSESYNTLAIAYLAAGDTQAFNQLKSMVDDEEMSFAKDVTAYQSGKKTLKEIYLGKGETK